MKKNTFKNYAFSLFAVGTLVVSACKSEDVVQGTSVTTNYPNIKATFGSNIDLNALQNYQNQTKPTYITRDNTGANPIDDKTATLGRVLFYDKNLSTNNTISCSSCHKQQYAFGDNQVASAGVNGNSVRHSMRLANARFGNEMKFFWDERASSLEVQTGFPVQDHVEMGFSGTNGDPSYATMLAKLQNIGYYKELFQFAFGDTNVTQDRVQRALAQFIRSIQSFDSKYDTGRSGVPNDQAPFTNYTAQENQGKGLFLQPPTFDASGNRTGGGLGCAGCHAAPEFDVDPNTKNNGIIGILGNTGGIDITITRAPSLRNVTNANGEENGPFMHTGNLQTLQNVIGHYGNINTPPGNTNLDPRLKPNGFGQKLNLTAVEVNAVLAFLKTLGGTDVYTNPKWSNPFL